MALMTKVRASLGTRKKHESDAPDTSVPLDVVDRAMPDADEVVLDESQPSVEDVAIETPEEQEVEAEAQGNWFQRRKAVKQLEGQFESYPHLLALKPKEKYLFRSDYYEVDGSVACVLAYFHDMAAKDGFAPFWGIGRIPGGLDDRVTAVVLEQVVRRTDKWIEQYTSQSEKLENLESGEVSDGSSSSSKRRVAKVASDMDITIGEIQDGASYLSVHNRLLLKAPDLATLEDSIETITRLYIDRFGTLKVAAYAGEQRQELSDLLARNDKKRGHGFHFTSTELAGSYSLVTNGLNDPGGEYVGYMVGDVNNSAVLLDTNDYEHHVVLADNAISDYLDRAQISDMWASKISQACLLNNGNVVHLVLDDAELDKLGPRFDGLTSRVDLNAGDVNPFEMFGDEEDELSIFATHMQKLVLMFEQLYETGDASVGSIIRSELEKTATQFYIDQRMWLRDAKNSRHRLRVVGIPHEQVPKLQMFVSYLDTEHKALVNSSKNDPDQLRAYSVLRGIAKNLLDNNGDLFNNHTADSIDGVREAKRVVYDFSRLHRRGKGVAMAQLVNIVSFAISKLGRGDTVIVHGVENIDARVKEYIGNQFKHLHQRGGRVVYSYNDIDTMLEDSAFNKFDVADYTIFGSMRDKTVEAYQASLGQRIPPDLAQLITRRGENLSYLRRGVSNVVFHMDLALGINPNREKQRREMQRAARQAEEASKFNAVKGRKPVPGANLTLNGSSNDERKQIDRAVRVPMTKKQVTRKQLGATTPTNQPTMTKRRDRGTR